MFLIDWIPSSVFIFLGITAVIVLLISPFITKIPFLAPYKLPLTAGAVFVIIGSAWMHGMTATKGHWEQKLIATQAELEAARLEVEVTKENARISNKVTTQIVYVKEKTNENIKALEAMAPNINATCKLPDAAIMLVDAASKAEVAGSPASAAGPSQTIEASDVLKTVTENYGICNEHIEIIKGWQDWYWTQKKLFEEAHNK